MATEVEAKFALRHLATVRQRVLANGGRVRSSRTLERNWRFDTADHELSSKREVLRVRQDDGAQLTFKQSSDDPLRRTEINVRVDDVQAARTLLQRLQFEVIAVYEKYREVFILDQAEVMLDELPFGAFVEIEAPGSEEIQAAAQRLGLAWERRVPTSYLELFQQLKEIRGLKLRDATFAEFSDLPPVALEELDLSDALLTESDHS